MTADNRPNEPTPEQVEAAAKALTDAADQWRAHWGTSGEHFELWLRARAEAYRQERGEQ